MMRNSISSRNGKCEGQRPVHIWSVGETAGKPESSCRCEGGRREGTERRGPWYLLERVKLNRQYFYCFISPQSKWKVVNMNKTMWPTEPSFKELETPMTSQYWLCLFSPGFAQNTRNVSEVSFKGRGTFADLKWPLCLRLGRRESLWKRHDLRR